MTGKGEYVLPDQLDAFSFDNQFIPDEWVDDFMTACHLPDAGDMIISGYQGPDRRYLAFVRENGSHGGVKEEEYSGFFIAPKYGPVRTDKGYVRPTDIRNGALELLGKSKTSDTPTQNQKSPVKQLRIMTYNVHSCVGMDGKLSPLRIAKVIEQFNPDIVALQELDVGHQRSGRADQAKAIADILKMHHFFFPAIALEEEQYGDAILSRFPMRLIKSDILPGHTTRPGHEPRGALWVEVTVGDRTIQVLNTHLGLTFQERRQQIQSLLGPQWLNHPELTGPTVFCGDFNFSRVLRSTGNAAGHSPRRCRVRGQRERTADATHLSGWITSFLMTNGLWKAAKPVTPIWRVSHRIIGP